MVYSINQFTPLFHFIFIFLFVFFHCDFRLSFFKKIKNQQTHEQITCLVQGSRSKWLPNILIKLPLRQQILPEGRVCTPPHTPHLPLWSLRAEFIWSLDCGILNPTAVNYPVLLHHSSSCVFPSFLRACFSQMLQAGLTALDVPSIQQAKSLVGFFTSVGRHESSCH